MILVLILFIFIFFILKYKYLEGFKNRNIDLKCEELINKLVIIKSNPYYRIGDIFYDTKQRHYEGIDVKGVLEKKEFDNTILREYLIKHKKKSDYKLLLNIINRKEKEYSYEIPDKNTLVIHLRAGDTVVFNWFLKKDYKDLIEQKLKKNPNINKIVFVCCLQYGDYKEKNRWMYSIEKNNLNKIKIKKLFKKLLISFPNLKFDLISNREIDKDITFMVKSNFFISDKGNISKLIEELRNYH